MAVIDPPAATGQTAATAAGAARQTSSGGSAFRAVWWRHVLVWIAIAFALFPILFVLSAALNPAGTLSTTSLLPKNVSVNNFDALFSDGARPYLSWYKNSLIIAFVGSAIAVFIGACAAYAFSRLRFRGRRVGLLALLLLQMFPALLAFVGLYITFSNVGEVLPKIGLNTISGLVLAYLGGAMGANVWLLKGYFDTVPRELDEAARVDGASHARIFFTVIMRLVTPILVTVFMISFVGLFGEFLLASIFLTDVNAQTLGVGLYGMTLGNESNSLYGEFAAGSVLAALPIMVLYLVFQRQLVSGLTQGSVK
ncbi:sugar ABC transporter permease [Flexivirga endophytica]|uniref:Sugar ABC transporter permease n=1 Tax=Flexivirga endophytica TaxID=1849103 RepID=A0A916WZX5_9MICO|nr:sugar ABC transporter permease [Flexivirga endophytica]GGB43748.1 sugar ABC transporter permease [Flexivirga endophytica]GHB68101.1 sugar ABC transporter permease [Flexivirga endophytica]